MLFNFSTGPVISSAIEDLGETSELRTEDPRNDTTGVKKTLSRAGNVHHTEGIVCKYVEGILASVSPFVDDFYISKPSATYLRVVHHAQRLGETKRTKRRETRCLHTIATLTGSLSPPLEWNEFRS